MKPTHLLAALAGAATVVLGGAKGTGYEPPNSQAYGPNEVLALRSQVASLEAALYVAELQACPSLGVHPVPPPARKAGRR